MSCDAPWLRFAPLKVVEAHQEAGQHHEEVDGEVRMPHDRDVGAGENCRMPQEHPERRATAQSVQRPYPRKSRALLS